MLALVRYANEEGRAFPGFATICRGTGVGRTKLIECLAELEARGLFVRRRHAKDRGSNRYELYPYGQPPTSFPFNHTTE